MNIQECNSSADCLYIDKPCFIIHILYGWLVIFISFLIDNFLFKLIHILPFLLYSFKHSYLQILTIFIDIFSILYFHQNHTLQAADAPLT